MAGDPAIVKVSRALGQLLAGVPGANLFMDRSEDDPVREEERPAICPHIVDLQYDPQAGGGETRHSVVVDVDFYHDVLTVAEISTGLAIMIAQANALIAADRTLGGMLETLELRSATADEQAVPDLGAAVLTLDITFITPRDDFTTICGATGLF